MAARSWALVRCFLESSSERRWWWGITERVFCLLPRPVRRRAETPREGFPSLRADAGAVVVKVAVWAEKDGTRKRGGSVEVRRKVDSKAPTRSALDVVCMMGED